jgi:opacity protein-like surface antigen
MARAGLCAALLTFVLVAFAVPAGAADPHDTSSFELGVYFWGAGAYGDVDTPDGEFSNNTEFSDVWDNLSAAAMMRGRWQSGSFNVVGDLLYLDLETDRKRETVRLGPNGGIEVEADAKFQLKSWSADLALGYEIFEAEDVVLKPRGELFAGARYWSVAPEIDVDVSGLQSDLSRDIEPEEAWVDAMIGARLAFALSPTVDLSVQGDGGGFGIGNSSKFAWMQMTALSWRFSEHWRLHLAYKFLQFRRDTGDVEMREQFRGPIVATSFVF